LYIYLYKAAAPISGKHYKDLQKSYIIYALVLIALVAVSDIQRVLDHRVAGNRHYLREEGLAGAIVNERELFILFQSLIVIFVVIE
jgi:hypothetical protein